MDNIYIKDEYIKLGQAIKLSGIAGSGSDAKMLIEDGEISVNGEVCTMRGKKLHPGDIFSFMDKSFKVDVR